MVRVLSLRNQIKDKNLTHSNIYFSDVLHTVTVYNTALNTQQNKLHTKPNEGREVMVSEWFHWSVTSGQLLFTLSSLMSYCPITRALR